MKTSAISSPLRFRADVDLVLWPCVYLTILPACGGSLSTNKRWFVQCAQTVGGCTAFCVYNACALFPPFFSSPHSNCSFLCVLLLLRVSRNIHSYTTARASIYFLGCSWAHGVQSPFPELSRIRPFVTEPAYFPLLFPTKTTQKVLLCMRIPVSYSSGSVQTHRYTCYGVCWTIYEHQKTTK